jgi:hypothetical protein
MMVIRLCAPLLALWSLTISPAFASCNAGAIRSESDVSRVEWSSYCFLGGPSRRTLGIVERLPAEYAGVFRAADGAGIVGTYESHDPSVFKAIVHFVVANNMEAIRLPGPRTYLDGCQSYLAVTRCNATLTISESQMDFDSAAYHQFDSLLAQLDHLAGTLSWRKVSPDTYLVLPSGRRYLPEPPGSPSPRPRTFRQIETY